MPRESHAVPKLFPSRASFALGGSNAHLLAVECY